VFESLDYIFIILECLKGGDLFDYLEKREHYVPEKRALELFKQITSGLNYFHEFGILHRDMKVENIMMTSNEDNAVPKLVDFGLSIVIRQD
jgi:serine/threonine protein kinase